MPPAVVVPPVSVAESVTEPPALMVDAESFVARLGLVGVTVRVIGTVWVSRPFVAVTFKLKTPATCPAVIVRTVELQAQPVGRRLRLVCATEADGPDEGLITPRVTVPVKPFTLPRLIDIEELLVPATSEIEDDGSAVIVKSTIWKRMEAVVWLSVPFDPVTVTT